MGGGRDGLSTAGLLSLSLGWEEKEAQKEIHEREKRNIPEKKEQKCRRNLKVLVQLFLHCFNNIDLLFLLLPWSWTKHDPNFNKTFKAPLWIKI